MSCSVNLLPQSCHDARQRNGRCRLWTAIVAGACVVALGGWIVQKLANQHCGQLEDELRGIEMTHSELERQLLLAVKARNDLVKHGRALAALRQEQDLSEQMYAVTTAPSDGIVFTEIQVLPAAKTLQPGRLAQNAKQKAADVARTPQLITHISGFATTQDELTDLINTLQHAPYWQRVELLRASRAPLNEGVALSFRLECIPVEEGR